MKINFDYKLDMEWDNLNRGIGSMNHPGFEPRIVLEMQAAGVDVKDKKSVLEFISDKARKENINISEKLAQIKTDWKKIEAKVITRMEKLFGQKLLRNEITIYLTLNQRCAYNIDQGYFFVNMNSKNPNAIAIHELLHLYTYQVFFG